MGKELSDALVLNSVLQRRYELTANALQLVREAARVLKAVGAVNAGARVASCIKSVEGAVRHAQRLQNTDIPPARTVKRPAAKYRKAR